MITIKLNNVIKEYDKRKVIDNLSFEIPEYSICGFLGANGAGKTTTLKLMSGLIDNNGGSIEILGEKITTKNQSREVRFLQDVPEFYNYMTSYEYLRFICELNNLDNIDSLIKETLELVGLKEHTNKRIGKFSRGMKQRIGIASNIISKPKVLFLDEPVSALDPIGRKEVFDLLLKLKGKTTILFSTHIIDDIERVCDRIVVIDKGKKVIEGTIADIKKKYLKDVIELVFLNDKDMKNFIDNFKDSSKYIVNKETLTIRINATSIKDTEESIFKILSKEKICIDKLDIITPTLEEIFMEEIAK